MSQTRQWAWDPKNEVFKLELTSSVKEEHKAVFQDNAESVSPDYKIDYAVQLGNNRFIAKHHSQHITDLNGCFRLVVSYEQYIQNLVKTILMQESISHSMKKRRNFLKKLEPHQLVFSDSGNPIQFEYHEVTLHPLKDTQLMVTHKKTKLPVSVNEHAIPKAQWLEKQGKRKRDEEINKPNKKQMTYPNIAENTRQREINQQAEKERLQQAEARRRIESEEIKRKAARLQREREKQEMPQSKLGQLAELRRQIEEETTKQSNRLQMQEDNLKQTEANLVEELKNISLKISTIQTNLKKIAQLKKSTLEKQQTQLDGIKIEEQKIQMALSKAKQTKQANQQISPSVTVDLTLHDNQKAGMGNAEINFGDPIDMDFFQFSFNDDLPANLTLTDEESANLYSDNASASGMGIFSKKPQNSSQNNQYPDDLDFLFK